MYQAPWDIVRLVFGIIGIFLVLFAVLYVKFKDKLLKFKHREKDKTLLDKFGVLVKLQLSEKIRWKRNSTKSQKLGIIAKRFGAMVLAYAIFTAVFYIVFNVMFFEPKIDLFIFLIFALQLISIIICTISARDILYISKDNQLLLTYPVPHGMIYASKVTVIYIMELIKSLTMTLPLFMAYATIVPNIISANYVISAIFYSVLLPLMPVLIGAIISIPFAYLSRVIKQNSLVKGIFSLILFGLLIFLTILITRAIQANSPIRILANYKQFNENVGAFLAQANKFALYANLVGKGMCGTDALTNFLYHLSMFGVIVVTAAISILVSLFTFYKLASHVSESASSKKHKGGNVAHKSTFVTFIRKELTLSIRNIGNFASDYVFLFIMPFLLIILTCIYVNVDRNDFGLSLTYGFIGIIALVSLCASNTASATAISSEGTEFALLKTAPGKTSNIIWSKVVINFAISLLALLLTFIILNIVLIPDINKGLLDAGKLWFVFFYVIIIEGGLLLWSIQIDILNPKLREFANSNNKSELKNASQSIVIGLLFSIIFSVLLIIVFWLNIPFVVGAIILLVFALAFLGLRLYFLVQYRNAYFEDIQL